MDRDEINNINKGPSIDATYQVSDHLAKWLQRNILEIDHQKQESYGGHVC
jgi:hypothetical protein